MLTIRVGGGAVAGRQPAVREGSRPGPGSGRRGSRGWVLARRLDSMSGASSSRGITLIEPSVSSTAKRTSSTSARPWERIAARTSSTSSPSSSIAFSSRRPSRTRRRGSPSSVMANGLRSPGERLERQKSSASRVRTATSPPHSVVLSPTIEFWTASLMTRMTTSSSTDSCPTSRLPEMRSAATRKR